MKKLSFIVALLIFSNGLLFSQVGINTDNSTPDQSAILDVKSADKGLLIPRIALTGTNDVTTITPLVISLLIYNTATAGISPNNVTPGYYYWNGSSWSHLSVLAGVAGTADYITKWSSADTLANSLVFDNGSNLGIGTTSPKAGAALDITSTTKGFLPPRMSHLARNAMANLTQGLVIYCNNCGLTGELEVYNGTAWTNLTGGVAAEGLVIGSTCLGGKVAYILQPGDPGYVAGEFHGLVAASSDQSTGIIWAVAGYQSTAVPGGTSTAFGSGATNTDGIIAQNGAGITYAAGLARSYNGGGFSDWYLPSKDELNILYLNKAAIGGFANAIYWCSSEYNSYSAWLQYFNSGSHGTANKNTTRYVRAVRTF